jgi:hypothetical protein
MFLPPMPLQKSSRIHMGGGWRPTTVAGNVLWLRADLGVSLATPAVNQFSASAGATATTGQSDPVGGSNAVLVTEDSSGPTAHYGFANPSFMGTTTVTAVVYLKTNGRSWVLFEAAGTGNSYYLNASTGASQVRTGSMTITSESVAGGWYKFTVVSGAVGMAGVGLYLADNTPDYNYTGNGTSGMYIYMHSVVYGQASAWADQSGAGDTNKNALQSTVAKQPAFVATSANLGNRPCLSFSGTADNSLVTGVWAAALAQPCSVYFVGRQNGTLGNHYAFDSINAGTQMAAYGNSGANSLTAFAGSALPFGTTRVAEVCGCEFNGASSKLYINAKTAVATGAAGANGATGMTIGNYAGGGTFSGWDIAEVAVYTGVLSAGDRALLMDYMGARYGITVGA